MKENIMKKILRKLYYTFFNIKNSFERKYTEVYVKCCPIKRTKIVFDNFFGGAYGDNPKYIAEEIHRQKLDWDMVWFIKDDTIEVPPYIRRVVYGSDKAKRELASAKVIVDNVRNGMRVSKKEGQIYLQTWHGGLGFKKVEGETVEKLSPSYVNRAKRDGKECDAIISACAYQSMKYKRYFWLSEKTEILEFGQPRCDVLFTDNQKLFDQKVRGKLNIEYDKGIILYAPTFRDDGSTSGYIMEYEELLDAFEHTFPQKFVMVVRMHPNVRNLHDKIKYNDRIINGSLYPDIQELYFASTALITDYSSVAFDFSLLDKPVFLYTSDYVLYENERGLLTDVYEACPFPKSRTNEELIENILGYSSEEYLLLLNKFKNEVWRPFDCGNAGRNVVEWLQCYMGK